MGDELVEATSGNTGLGIAWIGKLKGYKVTIITHDKVSCEKLALLKFFGASVMIMSSDTPAESEDHYVNVARRYAAQKGVTFAINLIIIQIVKLITIVQLLNSGFRAVGRRI